MFEWKKSSSSVGAISKSDCRENPFFIYPDLNRLAILI